MAAHPLYRDIASDLSQQVLQARRLRGELLTPPLDSQNRRLYFIAGVTPRDFIADPDMDGGDEDSTLGKQK